MLLFACRGILKIAVVGSVVKLKIVAQGLVIKAIVHLTMFMAVAR